MNVSKINMLGPGSYLRVDANTLLFPSLRHLTGEVISPLTASLAQLVQMQEMSCPIPVHFCKTLDSPEDPWLVGLNELREKERDLEISEEDRE